MPTAPYKRFKIVIPGQAKPVLCSAAYVARSVVSAARNNGMGDVHCFGSHLPDADEYTQDGWEDADHIINKSESFTPYGGPDSFRPAV